MQDKIMNMQLPLSQMSEIQAQIQFAEPLQIAANPLSAGADKQVDFGKIITDMVKDVDQKGQQASAKMTAVDLGQSDDLVGAMVASQTASLSFSAMVQVRNKLLTAYDDVMRMPV
ncbi:flagellar basal body protein FliE [Photobacterium aquae]|uniref:Flagellar hook-basal body complex protein FliE n=1 Tax=Photobacterium aquae TaxID=1195763 RepID=A0A0J1JWE3_9GAMM|nr:flagellar hook-basal body complex protein FliE [Photobacterium aquae]KLV06617.1 flagellar basal body protein FliE [Photobacterium aquae]